MQKFWEKVKAVFIAILKGFKFIAINFFKIFNTKEKLASIILTCFIWQTMPLSFADKLNVFALFFILGVLLLDIKDSK